MKYAVKMGSGVMIYIPSFIKTDTAIQGLIWKDVQTHRLHCDRINLLLFCQNKEIRLRRHHWISILLQPVVKIVINSIQRKYEFILNTRLGYIC
jgi:hypothetical protein